MIAPCYLGIDMRSRKEFLARNETGDVRSWDEIAKEIGADSLAYVHSDDLEDVIGFPVCKGCVSFPDGYPDDLQDYVNELYEKDEQGKRAYE